MKNINCFNQSPSIGLPWMGSLRNGDYPESRCHSFITDGKIQYLSDCFHELAGQTVDLPEIDLP